MTDILNTFFDWSLGVMGPVLEFSLKIALFLVSTGIGFGGLIALAYGAWVAISAGLRREERARCFIRLLETGLQRGRTIEETVASMSRARIRDMGYRLHLVAAWMEKGHRLGAALEEVPRFLPPQVSAMLRVGESIGNMAGILPVCRASLRAGPSDARKQMNNLMVLFLVSPAGPVLIWMIAIFVIPKFKQIAADMGLALPRFFDASIEASLFIGTLTAAIWLALLLFEALRGGQWLTRGLSWLGPAADWVQLRAPWKRKRLLRDFSAMLSSLIDAGTPEDQAIRLAAEATANGQFQKRAEAAIGRLRQGITLPEALQSVDRSGEFQWRLRNACRSGRPFSAALDGWNESLEARAFQEEQFCSQVVTTGFVLLNGLMVGLATIGVFRFLTDAIGSSAW